MGKPARLGLYVCVALLLGCTAASAAPEAPAPTAAAAVAAPEAWSLDYCIRAACEKHGSALSALQRIDAARFQTKGAGSSLFHPTLSARSTRSEGYVEAQQSGTTVRRTGSTSDEQHLITLNVNLWDSGAQRLAVRQARAGETTAQAGLRRTHQTLAYEVTNAYIRMLRAQHTLRVAEERLKQADAQKVMVNARIQAGDAAEVDIYPIEVQIASARVSRLAGRSDVRTASLALRQAMGLPAGPVPELVELPNELQEAPPLEKCNEQALTSRPEIQSADAGLDRARAGRDLTRLRMLPQFTSNARADRGLGGSSIANQWSINAVFSWSFYNRGDRADVDASEAGIRAEEADRVQLLNDITSEVEQAHLALESARERVEAAKASVAMARKNLEVAEAKYAQGLAIPLEIVDAQVANSNAELQAIEARYDYFLARAQLDRAMGLDYGIVQE